MFPINFSFRINFLKAPENQRFPGVFKGCNIGILTKIGLINIFKLTLLSEISRIDVLTLQIDTKIASVVKHYKR